MEASPARPVTLKGLSRFLIEHEPHGAGFDVAHPAGVGGGRVSIACRGCGATHEYATTTVEYERAVTFEAVRPEGAEPASAPTGDPAPEAEPAPVEGTARRVAAAAAASAPAPDAKTDPEPALREPVEPADPTAPVWGPRGAPKGGKGAIKRMPKPRPPQNQTRFWRSSRFKTAGLFALAVAAIAFAGIRVAATRDDSNDTSTPAPVATAPAAQGSTTGASGAATPPVAKPSTPPPTALKTVSTPTARLKVPADWVERPSSQGTAYGPADSPDVSLEVFSGNDPTLTRPDMISGSRKYLATLSTGDIAPAEVTQIDGQQAFELTATEPTREVTLTGVLSGSGRYILIGRQPLPANPKVSAELDAARLSLTPR